MLDKVKASENMIKQQLRTSGVLADNVLQQIAHIPREHFVPEQYQDLAYADCVLEIGHHQIMLQPKQQAILIQSLNIKPSDVVLEIGTGTGYLTAVMAKLAQHVYSYEIHEDFTALARQNLIDLNIDNVSLINDDANSSWAKHGPYDVICCTASMPLYPEDIKQSLTVGGRMFTIVGQAPTMQAMLISCVANQTWNEQVLFETNVPALINAPCPEPFNF